MASVEKKNHRLAPWWSAVLALAIALSESALAQEEESSDQQEAAPAEPVQRAFIRSAGDAGALAQRYPHLTEWLEPEGAPRVLALVEREVTDAPEGAMVIVADEGDSANAPLLEALRSRLTEAGWAAMTLGLEQGTPSLQLAKERLLASASRSDAPGEGDEAGTGGPVMIDVNDQAAEDLLEAHREEMNARLASAVAWFTERDYQQVMLVGIGAGAESVRTYLAEAPQAVTGAAWVAADFGARPPSDISGSLANAGGLPLLDMYASRDQDSASGRRAAFRRARISGYEAQPAPVGVRPDERDAGAIANRLVGWARRD